MSCGMYSAAGAMTTSTAAAIVNLCCRCHDRLLARFEESVLGLVVKSVVARGVQREI
jgi:hypothetical protein